MDYLTMDENVCPVCGKVFHTVIGREWGWTYKGSRYCAYHCMRHVEVRHRVRMGWQRNPLTRCWDTLSPRAKEVAEQLMRCRHLTKALHELNAAASPDRTITSVCKRLAVLVDEAQSAVALMLQALDAPRRNLANALFVEGLPLTQVALDLDIDTDLLDVKMCKIYEAVAEAHP